MDLPPEQNGRDSFTAMFHCMQAGDRAAGNHVFEHAYQELRSIAGALMRGERPAHTLGATGLVHEAFLGPLRTISTPVQNRGHFYALAALAMRRILLEHGRRRASLKRRHTQLQTPVGTPPDLQMIDLLQGIEELRVQDPERRFGCGDEALSWAHSGRNRF